MQVILTQREADYLLKLEKHYLDAKPVDFPVLGEKINLELVSVDKKEYFRFDIVRGRVEFRKITFQNRAKTTVILARLDIDTKSHRNPDGEEIGSPHIHVYREGYEDKWAYDADSEFFRAYFSKTNDYYVLLEEFMKFCNITKPPVFQMMIT